MTPTIQHLLEHSGLPGPRGNLELLHTFAGTARTEQVRQCLAYIKSDTANSPEEFVGMCGIVGYCVLHRTDIAGTLKFIRPYGAHASWRIREAVAIGIQELAEDRTAAIMDGLEEWMHGSELEQRAVVAALAEPKLLKDPAVAARVVELLSSMARGFSAFDGKISAERTVLRQALGYGLSVAAAANPDAGKKALEALARSKNRHIQWMVKENLGKNRLVKMDAAWVARMKAALK